MYNTALEIERKFKSVGLTCHSYDQGNLSYVSTVLTQKSCTATARVIVSGNDADTKIITNAFVMVPPQKREAGYKLLNELNINYKFAKFIMGDDGAVYAEYDIPVCVNSNGLGDAALEITLRLSMIINEAYLKIVNGLRL